MHTPPVASAPRRLTARRNAWSVFAAVSTGILIARFALIEHNTTPVGLSLSPYLFGVAGLFAGGLLVVPSRAARPMMLLAAFLVGAGAANTRLAERPHDHLAGQLIDVSPTDPAPLVRVRGTALDAPAADRPAPGTLDAKLVRFNRDSMSFTLGADSIIKSGVATPISGTLRVHASGLGPDDVTPGDRLDIQGLLRPVRARSNPGQPDPVFWARQSERAGALGTSAETIEHIHAAGALGRVRSAGLRAAARLHASASGMITEDRPCAPIVRAMLLGERSPDGRQAAGFARTGVSHLLAISGFHLAVLIALTVGVVRTIGDYPRAEAVVGLLFIAAYLLIIPVRTPILRAALLASVVLVAHFFARRWDRLTLLGWVAAGIAAVRPMDLTTLGFQLTVGVTALLVWLSETRHPWSFGPGARFDIDRTLQPERKWPERALGAVRGLVVTSLLVWIVSAPVIVWHTGAFNPLAPIAVVIATPIAAAIQVFGMAGMLLSAVSESLGGTALDLSHASACALDGVSGAFDRVPSAAVFPRVSVAWATAGVGAALFLIVRARLRDPLPWVAVAGVVFWFMIESRAAHGLDHSVVARIDMLDVGDGSCLLVRSGDDAFLWDAGSLRPGLGVRTIPRALRSLGAVRVPTAIITHANIDHYAALPDMARAIGLERVLVSAPALETMRASAPDSAEGLFLAQLARLGVSVGPLAQGDALAVGPATLSVLWPPAEPPVSIRARNDRSLVARLEIPTDSGVRRTLFNGDVQRTAMLMLLADDEPGVGDGLLDADIVELPHHGSHHDVAEAYLLAVRPSVVLQSTGPNRADDRRWNSVARSLDASWGVTALDGALSARIFDDGTIETGSVRGRLRRRNGGSRR